METKGWVTERRKRAPIKLSYLTKETKQTIEDGSWEDLRQLHITTTDDRKG